MTEALHAAELASRLRRMAVDPHGLDAFERNRTLLAAAARLESGPSNTPVYRTVKVDGHVLHRAVL